MTGGVVGVLSGRPGVRGVPCAAVLASVVLVSVAACSSDSPSASRSASVSASPSASGSSGPSAGESGGGPSGTAGSGGGSTPGATDQAGKPVESGGTVLGTKPGRGGGNVVFVGARSGSLRFGSSTCGRRGGTVVSFAAPDGKVDAKPKAKLTLTRSGSLWQATFVPDTADAAHTYTNQRASNVSVAQRGGTWVITLSGTKLATPDRRATLVVDGLLTCGRLT